MGDQGAKLEFLRGGSVLPGVTAGHDWSSKTPLTPAIEWPTSIKMAVGLILRSPVPLIIHWGEQGTVFYNDAFSAFADGRHRNLFGSAVRKGWTEVAAFNDNVMKSVPRRRQFLSGPGVALVRVEVAEQVLMNLDYSPVVGEGGLPIVISLGSQRSRI